MFTMALRKKLLLVVNLLGATQGMGNNSAKNTQMFNAAVEKKDMVKNQLETLVFNIPNKDPEFTQLMLLFNHKEIEEIISSFVNLKLDNIENFTNNKQETIINELINRAIEKIKKP